MASTRCSWIVVVALVSLSCAARSHEPSSVGQAHVIAVPTTSTRPVAPVPQAGCPDLSDKRAIDRMDFAKELGVKGTELKTGLMALAAIQELDREMDRDLKASCSALVLQLGGTDESVTAKGACSAAAKAIAAEKRKAGGSVRVSLVPPTCTTSMNEAADCAARCDPSLNPGNVQVMCEGGEIAGSCDGVCQGSCDLWNGGRCDGDCEGECSDGFRGACGGKCLGSCNGKTSPVRMRRGGNWRWRRGRSFGRGWWNGRS